MNVARKRGDEPVEEIAHRPHDGWNPCRGQNVSERPDRPTDVIADVRLVEPAAVIAHEVSHPAVPGRRVHEGECTVEMRGPDLLVAAAGQRERDDREPSDIVDA